MENMHQQTSPPANLPPMNEKGAGGRGEASRFFTEEIYFTEEEYFTEEIYFTEEE